MYNLKILIHHVEEKERNSKTINLTHSTFKIIVQVLRETRHNLQMADQN